MKQQKSRRKGRSMHALECFLCVFVICVFTLSVIILILSIVRAVETEDDDDDSKLHTNTHIERHHSIGAFTEQQKRFPSELKTLEALEETFGDNAAAQSGWLPRARKKRGTLASLDPFLEKARNEATVAGRAAVHFLDLRSHKKISDDTYYMGTHPHPHDQNIQLHSYAFVHKIKQNKQTDALLSNLEHSAKHKHFNRTHVHKRNVIECGAPIAVGARWKTTRGYYSHPINRGGMTTDEIILATEEAVDTWRCVFRELHMEPFGPLLGVILDEDEDSAIDFQTPTGDNHIAFGSLKLPDGDEDSTLAITVTHGRYGGHHSSRYIAEFSTIFNDFYLFADCAAVGSECRKSGAIDYQSIATHELGHAGGLDDLYSSNCIENTMYWSAKPGEINKRTLTEDDINSMKDLYEE